MLIDLIHERGPLPVAAFMDLALYHPQFGYYARATQRSGHAGDFFTSVDVGPLVGEILEIQLAEMTEILETITAGDAKNAEAVKWFDLVEAGAGNGRLSADILRAARRHHPKLYSCLRLHLVEASAAARSAQHSILDDVLDRLASSSDALPESFDGVLLANELLDAFPVHQVVMREEGLREVYVAADNRSAALSGPRTGATQPTALRTVEGPPSTPALADHLARLAVTLEPGWRAEINLRAVDWMREVARRLRRGFVILIDYGHEARDLYSVAHAGGTLTTFTRHTMAGTESTEPVVAWLRRPGEQDITAHVDFTAIRSAAEDEGLTTLGFLDQTYFLMGLVTNTLNHLNLQQRLALKTLLMPGGLGSTLKVLILGKGVDRPALRGCSYRMRVT